MGHPHIERLKTKVIESNEKLEDRDCCIATLRAQCAHADEERDRVTLALRNATERVTALEATNALLEIKMRLDTEGERLMEEQYNEVIQHLQRRGIEDIQRGSGEYEDEIRWLQGVEEGNKVEIRLLRDRVEEEMQSVTALKKDVARRLLKDYNTKRSVLRSFKWKSTRVDPDLLRVAIAFWGSTQDNSKTETSTRTTKEM
jgi:hypothetical protein